MLLNKEFRTIIKNLPRVKGTKQYPNYSVVNEGFPGKFNLSFTEAEMLDEFNSYIDINHDLIYSKIQPCVRDMDFDIILNDKTDKTHLALFDIADIHGQMILASNENMEEKLRFAIEQIWNFLTKIMGFDTDQIFISSFAGGTVKQTTKGKYDFAKELPKEQLATEIWLDVGLNNNNIEYTNRETFLALNLQRPTPWGYRNEIFVKVDNGLLDVATLEYLIFKPEFKKDKIVDIVPAEFILIVSGVGVERMLMAKNKLSRIVECDHIYPIYEKVLSLAQDRDEHKALILTESLRASHRVLTDSNGYANLSPKRKILIRKYFRALRSTLRDLGIPKEKISTLLSLNSQLQDYYPELKKGENQCFQDIIRYITTRDSTT